MVVAHDESTYHANEAEDSVWTEAKLDVPLRKKSEGKGIMVSGFCTYDGWLDYKLFDYGKGNYWKSENMVAHVKQAYEKFKVKYPYARPLFLFDNSSNHTKRAADGLSAKHMNVNPGGKVRQTTRDN
jgi:hypothetical protein